MVQEARAAATEAGAEAEEHMEEGVDEQMEEGAEEGVEEDVMEEAEEEDGLVAEEPAPGDAEGWEALGLKSMLQVGPTVKPLFKAVQPERITYFLEPLLGGGVQEASTPSRC